MGKDFHLHGLDSRQGEPPTSPSRSATESSRSANESNLPVDIQLEMERLRAERDAMAAELQIERAERLHVEERLRLLEREKLEQMRQGANSREKLASELEEARLRAMRSEARHAALEADTRLAELESRRHAPWSPGGAIGPLADEIAEPTAAETEADESPEDDPGEPQTPSGSGRGIPMSGGRDDPSKARPVSNAAAMRAEARARLVRDRAGGGGAAGSGAERRPPPAEDHQSLNTSRLRGPATAPRPPADTRGPGARAGAPSGDRFSASAPAGRRNPDSGAKGAPSGAAKGGAASGRPSIDRTQLEARLTAGAAIKMTERFSQFQPVAQSHIKVCDWLNQAQTLAAIEKLSAGQVAPAEILNVLILFFERSFLVIDGER